MFDNLKNNWKTEDIESGLQEVAISRSSILGYFNQLIRAAHGWDESDKYFDILAGEWIDFFCHSVVIAKFESDHRRQSNIPSPIKISGDTVEYNNLRFYDLDFYENLISIVSWVSNGQSPGNLEFEKDKVHVRSGVKEGFKEKVIRLLGPRSPDLLIIGPYYKCSRLKFAMALFKWRDWAVFNNLNFEYSNDIEINKKSRLKNSMDSFFNEFDSGILKTIKITLPLFLPAILFEDLNNFRNYCRNIKVSRPKIIYSANAIYTNTIFKQLYSEWNKLGSRLLYHQHGGGYGLDKIHAFEDYEKRVADRFMTWGWGDGSGNIVSVTPPAISKFFSRKKVEILLICGDWPKIPMRLHFQPMPGSIERMHIMTIDFLSRLRSDTQIWLKPYPHDFKRNQIEKMCSANPNVLVKSKESNANLYSNSKIVVHNYLGTSYLETLYLNIPTICIVEESVYLFRDDAESFYKKMINLNIIHFSSIDAAKFVENLLKGGQLDEWWASNEVQKFRKEFVEKFANFSEDWTDNLEMFFLSELKVSKLN